jgi:hypothetical protein
VFGISIDQLKSKTIATLLKQKFLQEIEPKWIEEAKKNGKLIEI